MTASAKTILDSISPRGDRLTTFEVVLWRPLLAEFNTHRWSRNGASSRAIPIEKQLARIDDGGPAMPISWPAEQAGMQGGFELEGANLAEADLLTRRIYGNTRRLIDEYLASHPNKSTRLHKSYLSRYLEPFMWQTMLFTTTEGQLFNFFEQRSTHWSEGAQAEFRAMADAVYDAYRRSTPTPRTADPALPSSWHLPYILDEEWDQHPLHRLIAMSIARCARISYLTQDGVRDPNKDIDLFVRLMTANPKHWSPSEHVAYPANISRLRAATAKLLRMNPDTPGNLVGWHQGRHSPFLAQAVAELRGEAA